MNYLVTKNALGEIISCEQVSPSNLIADAVALNTPFPRVEIWGGDLSGPLGAYPKSVFINGRRI